MLDVTNPIRWNAQSMTLSSVIDATDTLRQIFSLALREEISDEEIGIQVRGILEHWQKHEKGDC